MGNLSDHEIYLKLAKMVIADGDHPLAYHFDIMTHADDQRVGGCSFRVGDPTNRHIKYGGNIGYDIDEPHRGNKYSLKACRLLLPFARSHDMESVFITCSPERMASRRICELLGASYMTMLDLPEDDYNYIHHGTRKHCVYEATL